MTDRLWTDADQTRLAETLRQHHIVLDPTDPAREHDACSCGPIVEDWDEHWAEVVLDTLTAASRLAAPGELERLREAAADRDVARHNLSLVVADHRELSVEVERLRAEVAQHDASMAAVMAAHEADAEQLRGELERLRGELGDLSPGELSEAAREWDALQRMLEAATARVADLESELGDWRHNLAQRAFTAPDADLETVLASLDARIADLRNGGRRGGGHVATRVVTPADFPSAPPATTEESAR